MMFKSLVAVTCIVSLLFFGWFGWSEYQAAKIEKLQAQAELDAWGNAALADCRRIVTAWDDGNEEPARAKFTDVPLGLKSCRTLIRLN